MGSSFPSSPSKKKEKKRGEKEERRARALPQIMPPGIRKQTGRKARVAYARRTSVGGRKKKRREENVAACAKVLRVKRGATRGVKFVSPGRGKKKRETRFVIRSKICAEGRAKRGGAHGGSSGWIEKREKKKEKKKRYDPTSVPRAKERTCPQKERKRREKEKRGDPRSLVPISTRAGDGKRRVCKRLWEERREKKRGAHPF